MASHDMRHNLKEKGAAANNHQDDKAELQRDDETRKDVIQGIKAEEFFKGCRWRICRLPSPDGGESRSQVVQIILCGRFKLR